MNHPQSFHFLKTRKLLILLMMISFSTAVFAISHAPARSPGIPSVSSSHQLTPSAGPMWTVNLDAMSTSPTDNFVTSSASQVSTFRVSAILQANSSAVLTNVFGWQFAIHYDPTVLLPIGDPAQGSESATNPISVGAQTNCGFTGSWASLQSSAQAGSASYFFQNSTQGYVLIGFSLVGLQPAKSISANCQLASLSFEILRKPATLQTLLIDQVVFVDPNAVALPNVIAGSPAVETIANSPPTASMNVVKLVTGDPSCMPVTGSNCSSYAFRFDGSSSSDSDGQVVTWVWDFGDRTIDLTTGAVVVHDYLSTGTVRTTLRVVDNQGATGAARDPDGTPLSNGQPSHISKTVLGDVPPVAIFSVESSLPALQTAHFNALASYDPDGTIVSYAWDFGDGTPIGAEVTTQHTYTFHGAYAAMLTVTDDLGVSTNATQIINVTPLHPIANFTGSSNTALTGESVTFNASRSSDPNLDGHITDYLWVFGDGTYGSGPIVSHSFSIMGNYTVFLSVTDSIGASGNTQATERILDRPPVIKLTQSASTVSRGQIVQLTIDSTDPDGTISSTRIDWGDGTIDRFTGSVSIDRYAYSSIGTFLVKITVTDNNGSNGAAIGTIMVVDIPPVALFTVSPTSALTQTQITFDASHSHDPDGTINNYAWDFGDGSKSSGVVVGHSYTTSGIYTVTLFVTDNDLSTSNYSMVVTIIDRPPTATFTFSPINPIVGQSVTLDATTSLDPDGTIMNYAWIFGDTSIGSGAVTNHAYVTAGTFTIILTVTDNNGNTGSATVTIQITAITGAHASLAKWSATVKYRRESLTSNPTNTFYAYAINDGNRTVWVYATFTITSDSGANLVKTTSIVQLAPGQSIDGKADSQFTSIFAPTVAGAYSVTAKLYYSPSPTMPAVGDATFKPDLTSRKTFSFSAVQ